MFAYGLWALLVKVATRVQSPELTVVISYGTATMLVCLYLLSTGTPMLDQQAVLISIGSGVFLGIGATSYYYDLKFGDAAIASTITGLFFVVVAVLGIVFLGETVEPTDIVGFVLAALDVTFITW
jgi:transporter family protein